MKICAKSTLRLSEFRAENGLRLLYAQDSSNPIICLQLYIRVGSLKESSQEHGYAHFLEHLLFKSTRNFPDNELSRKATEMGAILNAYTDFDATCFYLILPAEELDMGMQLLSEMAFRACFSPEDVEIEKSIILEEIHQYEAEPEMNFLEYAQNMYFEDNPLSRPVLGDYASITHATHASLNAFYRTHYVPQNAFVVAVGDFDPAKLQLSLLGNFGSWQEAKMPQNIPQPYSSSSFRSFVRSKKGRDYLAIALPELPESHPDSEALHIAIRYLAIGKSSILHKRLVEKEKICSSVKVSSLCGTLPGVSAVLFSISKLDTEAKIISTFHDAWHDICHSLIPDNDIELVKKDIVHNWLYSFDSVEQMANLIAAEEFNNDLSRIQNYGLYIDSIKASDVRDAIRRYWLPKNMAVFIQSSKKTSSKAQQAMDALQDAEVPTPENNVLPKTAFDMAQYQIERGFATRAYPSYHSFTLANGVKLIYNYLPGRSTCGFALSAPLSQLNEHKPGLNYFGTALMLYGTRKRDHEEIMKLCRIHGFNIRALHHLDSSIFRGKCDITDLPILLEILSDIILEPVFDKNYLNMLKNAASDNIRRERDYPISVAYKSWFYQVFGKENNLYSATGNLGDIAAIKIADCEKWYEDWSLGRDFALSIVGSMNPTEVYELCEKHLGNSAGYLPLAPAKARYELGSPRLRRVNRGLDQAIIHIGAPACPAENFKENSAFHVLSHILGGDLSSRFYSILREKHGYAYQTGFDFSSISELGFWYAYAFCDRKHQSACLKTMQKILADLLRDGVHEEELRLAKRYLISMSRFDNESASFKAASIANLISLGYELDFFLSREERINSTDIDLINRLIKEYLALELHNTFVMV